MASNRLKKNGKRQRQEGQISISLEQEAGDLIFQINDDGQGFPHGYDTEQCFTEGKSTRKEVSEFSGRGSGLAAVREAVLQAGGHVVLKSPRWRCSIYLSHTGATTRPETIYSSFVFLASKHPKHRPFSANVSRVKGLMR